MLNIHQARREIIRPALKDTELWSQTSENLMVGVGLIETRFKFVKQILGIALGFYQMEPATYFDLIVYLRRRPDLANRILLACNYTDFPRDPSVLMYNFRYATLMCRVFFLRFPEPLPGNIEGLAKLWKEKYNTIKGKGVADEFIRVYDKYN